MFYTFGQNNSGGQFEGPAHYVIVEADNADEANILAEERGLYFEGCAAGRDCSCCGDRWYPQWPNEPGSASPEIYEEPPERAAADETNRRWAKEAGIPVVVVLFRDGTEKKF